MPLLAKTDGVDALEDLSQGNAAESTAVQGAVVFGGPFGAADPYDSPEDPPLFAVDETAFDGRALDAFLDGLLSAPRRRAAR